MAKNAGVRVLLGIVVTLLFAAILGCVLGVTGCTSYRREYTTESAAEPELLPRKRGPRVGDRCYITPSGDIKASTVTDDPVVPPDGGNSIWDFFVPTNTSKKAGRSR